VTVWSAQSDQGRPPDRSFSVQVVPRPLPSPLPLGFIGLAGATLTASGLQLHWIPSSGADWMTVGLILMVFPVPLQAIGAVMGFVARDAVAATGMGVLAATWLALGAAMFTGVPGQLSPGLGLLLIGAAGGLLVPAAVGSLTKGVAATVMGLASLRFDLTGAYEIAGTEGWRLAAGVCGLVLFAVALYAALAFEVESSYGRTVLPTGRRPHLEPH